MEEWKEYKLGEIANFTTGKLNSNAAVENGKYPFFTCSPQTFRINDYAFDQDAILLAGNNAEGKFNIKRFSGKFNAYQRTYVISEKDKNEIDLDYLFYALKLYLNEFKHISQGTATKFLTAQILNAFPIQLPTLETQQKIAAILSSLDEKIELNNKINENLEQQAQALFKSWFIDLEPFGGKMPEEWKVGKLSDIADYSTEKIEISSLNENNYYSTENMLPNKQGIEKATSLPNIQQTTRCLPGETIISNIRPYFKKIYYCTEEIAGCSTDVLCFKPKNSNYSEFLYQTLFTDSFFDYMVLGSKGTKMPRGDKQQIMNYSITIPDANYLSKFKSFVNPILSQIDSNRKENQKLSETRDSLLPKLMNGEIEV